MVGGNNNLGSFKLKLHQYALPKQTLKSSPFSSPTCPIISTLE